MADYGLLGGLGEGLKAGLQGYMSMSDMRQKREQAALEMAMKQKQMDMLKQHYEIEALKSGYTFSDNGEFGPENGAKELPFKGLIESQQGRPGYYQQTGTWTPQQQPQQAPSAPIAMPSNQPEGLLGDKLQGEGIIPRNIPEPQVKPKPVNELDKDSSTSASFTAPAPVSPAVPPQQDKSQADIEFEKYYNQPREARVAQILKDQQLASQQFKQQHPGVGARKVFISPDQIIALEEMLKSQGYSGVVPHAITEDDYKRMFGPPVGGAGAYSLGMSRLGMESEEKMKDRLLKEAEMKKKYEMLQKQLDELSRSHQANEKLGQDKLKKSGGLLGLEQRIAKLKGSDKARFDNSQEAIRAAYGMMNALNAGENTMSVFGDNNFTQQARLYEEALGRMQSGGAITGAELASFMKMRPTSLDDLQMKQTKLKSIISQMNSRLKTLGFTPGELGLPTGEVQLTNRAGGLKDKAPGLLSEFANYLSPKDAGVDQNKAQEELNKRKNKGGGK